VVETDLSVATVTSTSILVTTETEIVQTITVPASDIPVLTTEIVEKRAIETPSALTAYPVSAIKSGCRKVAILPATKTFTQTTSVTIIGHQATTTTTTAYEAMLSTATESATATTTATSTVAEPFQTDPICANQPYGGQSYYGSLGVWLLYCDSYTFNTTPLRSYKTTDMKACMDDCVTAGDCTGITYLNGHCKAYEDVDTSYEIMTQVPGSGLQAAVLYAFSP